MRSGNLTQIIGDPYVSVLNRAPYSIVEIALELSRRNYGRGRWINVKRVADNKYKIYGFITRVGGYTEHTGDPIEVDVGFDIEVNTKSRTARVRVYADYSDEDEYLYQTPLAEVEEWIKEALRKRNIQVEVI